MSNERILNADVESLYNDIVAKLGPHIPNTNIPRWNPAASIDQKLSAIRRMLLQLDRMKRVRSDSEFNELQRRFQRLSPTSWTEMTQNMSADEKNKLIQKGLAKLNARQGGRRNRLKKKNEVSSDPLSEAGSALLDPLSEQRAKEQQVVARAQQELLEQANELLVFLDTIDVHELVEIFNTQKQSLIQQIDRYKSELANLTFSGIGDKKGSLIDLTADCAALAGVVDQAKERARLDKVAVGVALAEEEFSQRKWALSQGADNLERTYGQILAFQKTEDPYINAQLRELEKALSKLINGIRGLTAKDSSKIENLEKQLTEFNLKLQKVSQQIDGFHMLLDELKQSAIALRDKLAPAEQAILLTEEINEDFVKLQSRIQNIIHLLDQKENQNLATMGSFRAHLTTLTREEEAFHNKFAASSEQREQLREALAHSGFYLTIGGWVVEKVADKNKVIGKVFPDLPPRQNDFVIKPITSSNRKDAEKIERYALSQIVIKQTNLKKEDIESRRLSAGNAAVYRHKMKSELPSPPPTIVYGYYGFYKNSDVVGFAPSTEAVTTDEGRRNLKFYPVGKHKKVGSKLQIQFDSNFDPHARNILTTRLPAPDVFVQEQRRYAHEDYASDFPMPDAELKKVPVIKYFLGKGGVVIKVTDNGEGEEQKEEVIATWSLNKDNKQIQISAINSADKQRYENLLAQGFNPSAMALKGYHQHERLINFTNVETRDSNTISAVTLAAHHELSGKYYIYEGGHLVFHIGEGADEKKYVLGKCELDGDKIKFNYTQLPPHGDDVITGKKNAKLVVKNAGYADYSKGGVPNTVLDLLPESERKKVFDKRLLAESRFDSPVRRPDVELAPVGSGSPVEASGPVSTDKTPGNLYLYSGGIVVEEKTIDSNVEKKVIGRWHVYDDVVRMEKVSPEEGDRLRGLLELPDYLNSIIKIKVHNELAFRITNYNYEIESLLKASRSSKVGYYRFRGDGSVWFCSAKKVNEPSPGFFAPNKKRKREWEYDFSLVGHWSLNDQGQPEITYTSTPDYKKYPKEDLGYFHLLTNDRLPRPLGHPFTQHDFKDAELVEAAEQLEKYSVSKDLKEREKVLASDNKAWHISLKRKEYSVFEDTYSGSSAGRHIIMTPADPATRTSQTFWHDTKNNTIGIPPGASIDQQTIDKYVELAGHFCKPKLDGSAKPGKMAIRFNERVRQDTRDAIVGAIKNKYPDMNDNIEIARDEAHFKELMSKDSASVSPSPPTSPRVSASK